MSRTFRNTTIQNPDGQNRRPKQVSEAAIRTWATRQRNIGPDASRAGWLGPDGQWHRQAVAAERCPWCDLTRNDKCFIHMSYHE
jgi:hypothetical protein